MTRWLNETKACEVYAVTADTLARYAMRGNLLARRPLSGEALYAEDGLERLFRKRGEETGSGLMTLGVAVLGDRRKVTEPPPSGIRERRKPLRVRIVPSEPLLPASRIAG